VGCAACSGSGGGGGGAAAAAAVGLQLEALIAAAVQRSKSQSGRIVVWNIKNHRQPAAITSPGQQQNP
jgi:O-acetyl-ADP-ribose deacetylase (regulator of RNase III)